MSSNQFFAAAFSLAFVAGGARAQAEAGRLGEAAALPIASVAAESDEALARVPANTDGSDFVVRSVESTAYTTRYVLEGMFDRSRLCVDVRGRGADSSRIVVGARVTGAMASTGLVLSAAGEGIAFVPNALGLALLKDGARARP
jgi:hypothetical protein